ncbi:SCP2 sterol-binding domain-containing protein [Pseudoroseicyclus sp. CXY001]|uniref:SCP2 sterol-binding domain-containing protein n=1 Tax=Pseudoroseicyclus sp. CXY001 TaxID=3242492 RepID=UPI003570CEAF
MSDVVDKAVIALNEKLGGSSLGGTAKFVIEDEGTILVDDAGARAEDGEADVTLSASAETFEAILDGSENPTAAFMSGKLAVDGDMGMAMKLAGALA